MIINGIEFDFSTLNANDVDRMLAAQTRQQEHETKMAQMPETVEQLKAENEALRKSFTTMESAQADADELNVDQAYRLTLLELGITE